MQVRIYVTRRNTERGLEYVCSADGAADPGARAGREVQDGGERDPAADGFESMPRKISKGVLEDAEPLPCK